MRIIIPFVIVVSLLTQVPDYNIPLDKDVQIYTYSICQENNISYELILSVIKLESNFDTKLNSYNDNGNNVDRGLCQHNNRYDQYHCELIGIENFDPYDAKKSIELCVKLIRYYYDYWLTEGFSEEESTLLALASYNMGLNGCINYVKKANKFNTPYSDVIIKHKYNLEQYGEFKD